MELTRTWLITIIPLSRMISSMTRLEVSMTMGMELKLQGLSVLGSMEREYFE